MCEQAVQYAESKVNKRIETRAHRILYLVWSQWKPLHNTPTKHYSKFHSFWHWGLLFQIHSKNDCIKRYWKMHLNCLVWHKFWKSAKYSFFISQAYTQWAYREHCTAEPIVTYFYCLLLWMFASDKLPHFTMNRIENGWLTFRTKSIEPQATCWEFKQFSNKAFHRISTPNKVSNSMTSRVHLVMEKSCIKCFKKKFFQPQFKNRNEFVRLWIERHIIFEYWHHWNLFMANVMITLNKFNII